ncbi:uncharacterized protein LOC123501680 [Portunus trituberculatus]|uniref:uncharacterized protein LOC123501680 n=1 Tax=Portunus trituberculatus TaxID=210409 RepID=UPI001E1D1B4E|nr:uncharacterized protein LOC123501680 [Portunus trituberculatus]
MAKTKAGPVRHNRRARNTNSVNNNKKHMQNGLYVHSSPPKALNADRAVDSARIKDLVRSGDVAGLEGLVLDGQGGRLLHQPATHPRVRAFLKTVPSYISKIELVHDAAAKGNLRELKALLDRRKLAQSKDEQGVGVLHKAVLKGHTDVVDYLITEFPESLDVADNGFVPHGRSLRSGGTSTPTLARGVRRYLLQAWVEDGKGRASGSAMAACRAWMSPESVALGQGVGLELELADWSDSDPRSCHPTPPSPPPPAPVDVSSTIPCRLPRLLPKQVRETGREAGAQLGSGLRLTDHLACVGAVATSPSHRGRTHHAYLRHLQRLAGRRPTLTHHRRLPNISRRPGSPRPRPRNAPPLLRPLKTLSAPARHRPHTISAIPPHIANLALPQPRPRSHLAPLPRGRAASPPPQLVSQRPRGPPWAESLARDLVSTVVSRALARLTGQSTPDTEVWQTACEREMSCRAGSLVRRVLGRQGWSGEDVGSSAGASGTGAAEEVKSGHVKMEKETKKVKNGKEITTRTRNGVGVRQRQQGREEDEGRRRRTKNKHGEEKRINPEGKPKSDNKEEVKPHNRTQKENKDAGKHRLATPPTQTLTLPPSRDQHMTEVGQETPVILRRQSSLLPTFIH